jgi:hypothetical protein
MSWIVHLSGGGSISTTERASKLMLVIMENEGGFARNVVLTIAEAHALAAHLNRIAQRIRARPEGTP